MVETVELVVPVQRRPLRIDAFLATVHPERSRNYFQKLIAQGSVEVDGRLAKASVRVRGHERVRWNIPEATQSHLRAEDIPLAVVFEDADLLVVDKPAGLVVHPGAGRPNGTLVNALLHRVGSLSAVGGVLRPGIVHRLDKDTSGLLVVAKTEQSLTALQRLFAAREVEKKYLAYSWGEFAHEQGTFRTLFGRHPRNRVKFTGKVSRGKGAVTHYRVLERYCGACKLEIGLETGRTHQIRVHLSEAGHPLIGDTLYGRSRPGVDLPLPAGRQALHAAELSFVHPGTGRRVNFRARVPKELLALERVLRGWESKVARRR